MNENENENQSVEVNAGGNENELEFDKLKEFTYFFPHNNVERVISNFRKIPYFLKSKVKINFTFVRIINNVLNERKKFLNRNLNSFKNKFDHKIKNPVKFIFKRFYSLGISISSQKKKPINEIF